MAFRVSSSLSMDSADERDERSEPDILNKGRSVGRWVGWYVVRLRN